MKALAEHAVIALVQLEFHKVRPQSDGALANVSAQFLLVSQSVFGLPAIAQAKALRVVCGRVACLIVLFRRCLFLIGFPVPEKNLSNSSDAGFLSGVKKAPLLKCRECVGECTRVDDSKNNSHTHKPNSNGTSRETHKTNVIP